MTTVLNILYNHFHEDIENHMRETAKLSIMDEEFAQSLENDPVHKLILDPIVPDTLKQILILHEVYTSKYNPLLLQYGESAIHKGYRFKAPQVVEESDKGKLVVDYDALTDYLIKYYCIITFNKTTYIFNGSIFVEDKGEIAKAAEYILTSQGYANKKRIRDTINEILARIQWRTTVRDYPFNYLGRQFIPVKNGVIWRERNILLPHSPGFGYTYRLPVKYDPDAQCPKIDKFISEIVRPEDVQLLYEIPASCLLQDPNYHECYMLVGSGSNGKSTYMELLRRFLGYENVTSVSLQDLCENRFKAAQLVGKLANIYPDLPKRPIIDLGTFKALTGGDTITVERKHKDPFEIKNFARFIFAANELPEVNDRTYAFWRRWIIIEFPNTFPPNPELIDELTTEKELSGFLNKVLLALTKIELTGLTKPDTVEKMKEEWMKKSNSVYAFVVDCIEQDPNSWETKDDVYNAYCEYCDEHGFKTLPKHIFAREIQRFVPTISTVRKRVSGERLYAWQGIKLKRDALEAEGEEEVADFDLDSFLAGD